MLDAYQTASDVAVRVLLALALIAGAICLVDWAIRTRRINPFSPVSRFFRRWIDPLMKPIENVLVRRGGVPQQAPFYAFMAVIVIGIVLIQVLRVVQALLIEISIGATSPQRFVLMLLSWVLRFLSIALLVRVISSWLPVSPYSKWVRWSYVSTEWLIAPIRRVVPPFGSIDASPLIAYFVLWLAGGFLR